MGDHLQDAEVSAKLDDLLTAIAKKHLNIPTLEARQSDSLDFHEVAAWNVKDALKAAFMDGAAVGTGIES